MKLHCNHLHYLFSFIHNLLQIEGNCWCRIIHQNTMRTIENIASNRPSVFEFQAIAFFIEVKWNESRAPRWITLETIATKKTTTSAGRDKKRLGQWLFFCLILSVSSTGDDNWFLFLCVSVLTTNDALFSWFFQSCFLCICWNEEKKTGRFLCVRLYEKQKNFNFL